MSIKRYDPNSWGEMEFYDSGGYVLHSDYDALLARHNALREAVVWERECQAFTYREPLSIDAMKELLRTRYAARAEVDRLIATDDCKGE